MSFLFADKGVYATAAGLLPGNDEVITVDVQVNDVLVMKKPHPCGSDRWKVTRVGMDLKMTCCGCGHQVMLPRSKAEKSIKSILREGEKT